jgi:hypothetical protein
MEEKRGTYLANQDFLTRPHDGQKRKSEWEPKEPEEHALGSE